MKKTKTESAWPYIVLYSIEFEKLYGKILPNKSWNRKAKEVKIIVNAKVTINVVKNFFNITFYGLHLWTKSTILDIVASSEAEKYIPALLAEAVLPFTIISSEFVI